MNIKYHRINESELSSLPFNEGSMYFCKDTGKLYADPIGGGVHTLINDCINDDEISNLSTWSSDKINDKINNNSDDLSKDYNNKIKLAAPANLLDNSDFTNPVNQRDVSIGNTPDQYFIDRWKFNRNMDDATYQLVPGTGIKFGAGTWLSQFLPLTQAQMDNKTYTIAVWLADGTVWVQPVLFTAQDSYVSAPWNNQGFGTWFTNESWRITLSNLPACTIKHIALYEGEYTADTLPEYRPKGYGNELMECQRYYRRYSNIDNGSNIFLTGFVSSSATGIYCSSLNNLPMRIPSPTINFTGIAIIRTIDGYETTSGSAGYTNPIVDLYYDGSDAYLAPLRFRKQDGSAWGITNNTPVHIMIKSGILEITADL